MSYLCAGSDRAKHRMPGNSGILRRVTTWILVGHGAPPKDAPGELVSRLKALEGRRRATRSPMGEEERLLDAELRAWPRSPSNDPYREGVLALAAVLRKKLPEGTLLVVAFNEFCGPSLEDAVETRIAAGDDDILVVPTMFTPGGVHAEVEIPEAIASIQTAHPSLRVRYLWPFDLELLAELIVRHVGAAAT
jgi:sirohydrochlorin cobaltochelatase